MLRTASNTHQSLTCCDPVLITHPPGYARLIAPRRFLHLPRLRAGSITIAIPVTVAMPTFHELGIDLFGTIEPLAVIAIIRERHEFLELLAEADARRALIKMEDVVDGPLRFDLDELIITTPQPDERTGVDL